MDPGTILAVATASVTAVVKVTQYIRETKHAKEDRQEWIMKLSDIRAYLEQLTRRLEKGHLDKTAPWYLNFIEAMGLSDAALIDAIDLKSLSYNPDSLFGRLVGKLHDLEEKLRPHPGSFKRLQRNIFHTLIKPEIAEVFDEISYIQSQFSQTLQLEHFDLAVDTHKVVLEVRESQVSQQRKTELGQLSKLDFRDRQNQIYATCFQEGVPPAQWFLTSEEFISWRAGRPWPLHCHGRPGAGKTVLSSIVIRHLEEHIRKQANSERHAVLYLYLDYKETKLQTYSNLIRSLLQQLIRDRDFQSLGNEAQKVFQNSKLDDQKVLQILNDEIASPAFQRVYLVVDALDEFEEADRASFYTTLQAICPDKVSLLVTSRDTDNIHEGDITCMSCPENKVRNLSIYFECPTCPKFHICQECRDKKISCRWNHELQEPRTVIKEIRAPDDEIERFVNHVLKKELGIANARRGNDRARTSTIGATRLGQLFPSDSNLADKLMLDIATAVVNTAEGMFLLAKLHLDSLRLQTSLASLKRALRTLSTEVHQVYGGILNRIRDQRKDDVTLAMQALALVVFVNRPLEIPELLQILAVREKNEELDPEEQPDFTIILRVTSGLLSAEAEQGPVRLVHRTAQEYFNQHWSEYFPSAKLDITRNILIYLNFKTVSKPCSGAQEDQQIGLILQEHCFMSYASIFWGDHAREVIDEPTIEDSVLKLLEDSSRLAATVQAAWYVGANKIGEAGWELPRDVTPTYICAWYGLDPCISTLYNRSLGVQVNDQDEKLGRTPLMYACMRGHISTALTLLRLGADINLRDKKGNTALIMAIWRGHPQLVDQLLKQKIDPLPDLNIVSEEYLQRNALMLAALKGYDSLVTQIIRLPGIRLNEKDVLGNTALALAATGDQLGIVTTLLERVEINTPNAIGSTPLIIAAQGGKLEMVEQMLKKGADHEVQNHDGHNALSKAILHGHDRVVQVLLNHAATTGSSGNALHIACASEKTKPDLINNLVKTGLNVNALNNNNATSLHKACQVGKSENVEALLALKADHTVKDRHDRTPLIVAWQNGHSDVVQLLQNHATSQKTPPEPLPTDSTLPTWSLAKLGHVSILQSTLKASTRVVHDRDPDTDSTALHWAIRSKHPEHLEITEILLQADAEPNALDDHKRTPLHIAAYLDNYEATELLLSNKAEPNIKNTWDLTPLAIAQSREHYFVAVKLIEGGANIQDGEIGGMQGTLCAAVQIGDLEVAKKLLAFGEGVDLEGRNKEGQSVVELARLSGDDDMAQWVREVMYGQQPR
ncbi:MAG: hypothetical protein Q9195_000556 [Heterodermia aff. obscurata]